MAHVPLCLRHGGVELVNQLARQSNPILFQEHSFYSMAGFCFGAFALNYVPRRVVALNIVVRMMLQKEEGSITYARKSFFSIWATGQVAR